MLRALDFRLRYGLSYWDAAIVSAAQASGSSLLLTEDLGHAVTIDGLEIANPFRE
jgi:predicted nucleic acid-binding protein